VGYAGGEAKNPDYGNIGDHTETVQVDYDPRRISYEDLLALFWESHRPGQRAWRRQYMNAVFYHDEKQRLAALNSKAQVEEKTGRAVHTQILPLRSFTLAEAYHQKYLLRRDADLSRELKRIYPGLNEFINSTAVTRLNGYVGGYGSMAQLERELGTLGISAAGRKNLVERVRRSERN
jgi:methionine-S-sulfoxide reductase